MEINEAVKILRHTNLWRRDNDGIYEPPNPKELGIAIDVVVEYLSTDKDVTKKKDNDRAD